MIDKDNEILLKKLVEIQAGKRVSIIHLILYSHNYQRLSQLEKAVI